jgi:hypothetical protein
MMLSEKRIQLIERDGVDFRCRHIESPWAGELLNWDAFYWGSLKGVGKELIAGRGTGG